jgi:hypothetical protein
MKKIMYLKITWDDRKISKEGIQTFLEHFLTINAKVEEIIEEDDNEQTNKSE